MPLDKLAVWILGDKSPYELLFAESCIAVEIHSPYDLQNILALRQVSVFPQERLEILLVDETIAPVIDLLDCLFVVELLAAFNCLLLLFHGPIKRYFKFDETGELGLDVRFEDLRIGKSLIWPLCDVSSQTWFVARHHDLQEVVKS